MKQTFYSNGKLLLTSEYLVLDGAKALAVPTKFGQDLTVEDHTPQVIQWTSFDANETIWFEATFSFQDIRNHISFENEPEKNTLIAILHEAYLLNPTFLEEAFGYKIITQLGFPRNWGLGTSSTLINNIAQWLQIDAFTLLKNSFGGSGYDIACAQNDTAIIYRLVDEKPEVKQIAFHPDCASDMYFLYLNQKQNSKSAIAAYHSKSKLADPIIPFFDGITEDILEASDFETMRALLLKHENKMSEILSLAKVQYRLFPDFEGTIKSLGAWGGDFVLVLSQDNPTAYFSEKGYTTILPYAEMIL